MKNGLVVWLVGLSALAVLAACEDPTASNQAPPASPAPLASAQDPNIRESASAAPDFDMGHTVHLTAKGIQPKALVSMCCNTIVFKNETTAPATIVWDTTRKSSGPIAPGGTWTWTPPNPESVTYHLGSAAGLAGQIQIESPNW